jgi:hypothetical protein
MTSSVENVKLAELRAKTDWDLFHVISKDLDRGFVYASVVTSRDCSAYEKAGKIYAEVVILLAMAYGLSEDDRAAVEETLDGLRLALDRVPPGNSRRQAAGLD